MTYEMKVIWIVVWAVLAELVAIALTGAVLIRKAPPLTTQKNQQTGMVEHGIIRWFLLFSAFTIAPPVAIFIATTILEVLTRLSALSEWWWVPLVIVTLAALVGFAVWAYRDQAAETEEFDLSNVEAPPALPHNPIPVGSVARPAPPALPPTEEQMWGRP